MGAKPLEGSWDRSAELTATAYLVTLSLSLCWITFSRSGVSWDSPSVMTIITFLAPFLPPFWKASELEPEHRARVTEGGGDGAAPGARAIALGSPTSAGTSSQRTAELRCPGHSFTCCPDGYLFVFKKAL